MVALEEITEEILETKEELESSEIIYEKSELKSSGLLDEPLPTNPGESEYNKPYLAFPLSLGLWGSIMMTQPGFKTIGGLFLTGSAIAYLADYVYYKKQDNKNIQQIY